MLENSKTIIEHRKEIDKIDSMIVNLLYKRFEIVRNIAKYKKKRKLPIFSRKRENEAIISRCRFANEKNISEKFISLIFKLIFKESRHIQRKIITETRYFDKKRKI